ncbi:unnamed protein product [Nyctereutes procyonoides]|uniref:(raccoon dog) hypothetical protein n=1 Tax=Nyctereutes procyonoides TaxID=34880 RepID=A0A811Y7L6_NYCPR|nr:unnamed protein product [Nyctereutes procyonoides]
MEESSPPSLATGSRQGACFFLCLYLCLSVGKQRKQVASNEDLRLLKKCILCGKCVDYKRVQLLSQFISLFTGCIYGKHITSLWEETEGIIKAIKRAQIMGFVPVTYKDSTYLKEHKSCNIKYQE